MTPMIERLECRNMHEKSLCRPDVYAARVCAHAGLEIPNRNFADSKIAHTPESSELGAQNSLLGTLLCVKRKVIPIYSDNKGM